MNTTIIPYPTTRPVRRKRLKVVNACEECRRRKTKCDGQHPCTRCSKSHIECKYKRGQFMEVANIIESIEERLSVIEATLRAIIDSTNNKQNSPPQSSSKNNSSTSSSIQHLLNK